MRKLFWICAAVALGLAAAGTAWADMSCLLHPVREGERIYVGPVASSTLLSDPDDDSNQKYSIEKAFDRDRTTAWAEGADGPGVGVEISFAIPLTASRLTVANGFSASRKLFAANNRVKDIDLEVRIGVKTDLGDCFDLYVTRLVSRKRLALADRAEPQAFALDDLGTPARRRALEKRLAEFKKEWLSRNDLPEYVRDADPVLIGIITIKSVYRGAKYDDTCLTEVSVE